MPTRVRVTNHLGLAPTATMVDRDRHGAFTAHGGSLADYFVGCDAGPEAVSGVYKDIVDNPDPAAFKLWKSGKVVINAVALTNREFFCDEASISTGDVPYWGSRTWSGHLAAFWRLPFQKLRDNYESDIQLAKSLTLVDCYSDMNQALLQGFVTVIETKKTLAMLHKPMGKALELINKILARKLTLMQRGLTAAQAFAAAWLEYHLGWKPLIMDINGALSGYHELRRGKTAQQLVKRKSKKLESQVSGAGIHGGDETSWVAKIEYKSNAECQVSSGVIFVIDDVRPGLTFNRAFGLSLRDVPDAIWELIPFSFVVDYFVNVQGYINSILVRPEINVLGSWTSTKKKWLYVSTVVAGPHGIINPLDDDGHPAPYLSDAGGAGNCVEFHTSFTREKDLPLPNFPVFQLGDLGKTRITTIISLIVARINGGSSRT